MIRLPLSFMALLLGLLSLGACEQEPKLAEVPKGPDFYSKLPPVPVFESFSPLSDGSYSVKAAIYNKESLFEKKISVTGYAHLVHVCPRVIKTVCTRNHVLISDKKAGRLDPEDTLMMTDFENAKGVIPGNKYVFSGTFSQSSPRGFQSTIGLLISANTEKISAVAIEQ